MRACVYVRTSLLAQSLHLTSVEVLFGSLVVLGSFQTRTQWTKGKFARVKNQNTARRVSGSARMFVRRMLWQFVIARRVFAWRR
jgi:hypothetical protein